MYGSLPVAYFVKKNTAGPAKWYLRTFNEDTLVCTWTQTMTKAHTFTSESGCREYIAKYLRDRDVTLDQRVINPYAYAMGYMG